MVAGFVLLTPSAWTILGGAQAIVWVALQARLDEQHLAAAHGEPYRGYAASVGRFWPGIGKVTE